MIGLKRVRAVLAVVLALGGCERSPGDGLVAAGTVKSTEISVAPLTGGRLVELRVREGDAVEAGDTIALLSRAEVPGELEAARARVAAAEARLRQLEAGSRREDVAVARAQLGSATGDLEQAQAELTRVESLLQSDLATAQDRERATAALVRARSQREVAERTLERLVAGSRREEVEAARAELEAARAVQAQVQGAAGELVLVSPVRGVVLLRNFERGEVVGAGVPVVVLVDPADLWMRVYVGQQALARVRLGQGVRVTADAVPADSFEGRVVEISPRAEFTPRVALTEQERADLVFGVRLTLVDPSGRLKPGMPAEARIRVDDPAQARRAEP
jgi:HlyD family secretion protein